MINYREVSTLYASPAGNSRGLYPSTEQAASLSTVLRTIYEMRGGGIIQPITVKLHGGEYCFSGSILFPTPASNVTFEPFGDGDVIFSGARRITGFERTVFNGVDCFGVYIDDVKNGNFKFTDLYVDGLRADFTRYPSEGYLIMKSSEYPHANRHDLGAHWFVAADEDIEKLSSLYAFEDCFISFNHYWVDEHTPVKSLDKATGTVTMEYISRDEIHEGQEYIIENVAEAFSKPNEWYLDRQNGMLYYIPRDGSMQPDSLVCYAPVTTKFFAINGSPTDKLSGIRFRDITFAYTRGDYASNNNGEKCASDPQSVCDADGIISLSHLENSAFENCTFRNYGLHGLFIGAGCHGIKVEHCRFYDGGAGGIKINGATYYDNMPLCETYGNTVSDCRINHVGRRYLSACGILSMNSYENNFVHNEISDLYYTGISCGWVWGYTKSVSRNNIISDNHIFDLGKGLLSDMGGIYLLGAQPGTVVRGNKIHDIKCKFYGGWALYTDEGSAGMLLESNLCYNTSSNCYHQHYGACNVVRDNIFAYATDALMRITRHEPNLSIVFTNNIYYTDKQYILSEYKDWAALLSNRNIMFSETEFKYCEIGPDGKPMTLEEASAYGLDTESIVADPLFTDAKNFDFTLDGNSPAYSLGFVKYDWSKVGPRE